MGVFSLCASSVLPGKLFGVPTTTDLCLSRRKAIVLCCQGSGNVMKSSGLSSVLTERSALVSTDHSATVMDAGSLVLSPNGNNQTEIVVKDLVPYAGTNLIGLEEGIGIVNFLRGKKFFITGATGFLAKGISCFYASFGFLDPSIIRVGCNKCLLWLI